MSRPADHEGRLLTRTAMRQRRQALRAAGQAVCFTNGCFDLLHAGHVEYLEFARRQAQVLIVGLNSDRSVRRLKGAPRPLVAEHERARLLLALRAVDYVVLFDEDEPRDLIAELLPDVLVKGRDWAHYVSGGDLVQAHGGKVVLADLVPGRSSSGLIERILAAYGKGGA